MRTSKPNVCMQEKYQLHDSCGPTGEEFDALMGHVHQLGSSLIVQGEAGTGDDLCVCVCVCVKCRVQPADQSAYQSTIKTLINQHVAHMW